jgi:hypothetical protein
LLVLWVSSRRGSAIAVAVAVAIAVAVAFLVVIPEGDLLLPLQFPLPVLLIVIP